MKKLIAVLFLALTFAVPAAQAVIVPHVVKGVFVVGLLLSKYGTPPAAVCFEKKAVKDGSGNDTNAFSNSEVACK